LKNVSDKKSGLVKTFDKNTILQICFKIKNPPTLHSTSKIHRQPSPTFVFSVFQVSEKSGVMKENLTAVLVIAHRAF
jgi:hypothetical protein